MTEESPSEDTRGARRYRRVQAVFDACLELEPQAREQRLAQECGDDLELLAEVKLLLEVSGNTADIFSEAELARGREKLEGLLEEREESPTHSSAWMPERIGAYRILNLVGRGGMGVVYEAEQIQPRRRVALKLIHPGQSSVERTRRFRREAEVLGRLNHPGIAQIFESGSFDLGAGDQPFFAMEFIDGVDLLSYCERERLDLNAKLSLVVTVADAIQSAHRIGVVHRDLKPDNILVDSERRPKVLDFGIALSTGNADVLSTLMTEQGQILGTLAYMAPEQLAGDSNAITPRADVYALGVIAFELLSGELPLNPTGLPITAGLRLIASEDPRRLSSLRRNLRGDIDTIIGKALEKDPARRYESMEAFAADIERYLNDLPIAARPPSRVYRMRKFAARHRGLVAALVILLLGVVASTLFGILAREQTAVAQQLKSEVDSNLYFAEMQLAADLAEDPTGGVRMRELLAHWLPTEATAERRGWEWFHLEGVSRPTETVISGPEWILTTEWHPTRQIFITGEMPARIYDAEKAEFIAELPTDYLSEDVAWSPSGDEVILCGAQRTQVYEFESRVKLVDWQPPTNGGGVTWHPSGRYFLNVTGDGKIFRFEREDWQPKLVHQDPELFGGPGMLEFHPGGKELAVFFSNRAHCRILDTESWQVLQELAPPASGASMTCAAWDPAGELLATGAAGGEIQIWKRADWSLLQELKHHSQFVTEVSWSADGKSLASSCRDSSVQICDPRSGRLLRQLRGHSLIAEYVDWDAGGNRLVSCSKDKTLRLWQLDDAPSIWTSAPKEPGRVSNPNCSWSPDGARIGTSLGGPIEYWDFERGQLTCIERTSRGESCYWSQDGRFIATRDESRVLLLDARDGRPLAEIELAENFTYWVTMSWNPVQKDLLAVGNGESVWTIDFSGEPRVELILQQQGIVRCVEWNPAGDALLVVAMGGLRVCDVRGTILSEGPRWRSVESVDGAWSPDGTRVAVAQDDLCARIFVVNDWREEFTLRGHNNQVLACDWSPDGTRLATGDQAGVVKLWDTKSGRLAATLSAGGGAAHDVEWSPSGAQLAVVTHERLVRIWDSAAGRGDE